MQTGVDVLADFKKDKSDRNRTSPFAFTGNKFEFRSLGSSASISDANVVLNTAVAESLKQFADELESAEDFRAALHDLIVREIRNHKRILFDGNGYAQSWVEEAEKRGLCNLRTTIDALPRMIEPKNIKLFADHRVFSETEVRSRFEIKLEEYTKIINIEAETALMMAKREILPAVMKFTGDVARQAKAIKDVSPVLTTLPEEKLLTQLTAECSRLSDSIDALQSAITNANRNADALTAATYQQDVVIPAMNAVRTSADELETIVGKEYWPFPTYAELLFNT